jgi:transposase
MSSKVVCSECFRKQQKIYRLEQENISLKAMLRYQERTIREGYFGSGTPSSKKPFKSNTPSEQKKRGGAKEGHKGHGRNGLKKDQADSVEKIAAPACCPDCGTKLENKGSKPRTVYDIDPIIVKRRLYQLEVK